MDRGRRKGRNNHKNWNDKKNNIKSNSFAQRTLQKEAFEELVNKERAIRALKEREVICPLCSKPIFDITSSLSDKKTGEPVHFDCAHEQALNGIKLKENEKFTYIGNGRFAVLSFPDIRDMRHFKIEQTVEWERRETTSEWRQEISNLFSQT